MVKRNKKFNNDNNLKPEGVINSPLHGVWNDKCWSLGVASCLLASALHASAVYENCDGANTKLVACSLYILLEECLCVAADIQYNICWVIETMM
jgi:hypothetical protein